MNYMEVVTQCTDLDFAHDQSVYNEIPFIIINITIRKDKKKSNPMVIMHKCNRCAQCEHLN